MNTPESRKGLSPVVLVLIVLAAAGVVMVAIVGLLAAIAVPNFLNAQVRAKIARTQAEVRMISIGLESYRIDNGVYPPSLNNLTTPIAYLSQVPSDPFLEESERYGYRVGTATYEYLVLSVGPDEKADSPSDLTAEGVEKMLIYYDSSNGIKSRGDVIQPGPERQPN